MLILFQIIIYEYIREAWTHKRKSMVMNYNNNKRRVSCMGRCTNYYKREIIEIC